MFGEPSDKEGECNARLFIADNYGDGSASIRCQLALNHDGLHKEEFERHGHMVTITWAVDERKRCDHGCGRWDHAHSSKYDDDGAPSCPRDADDHAFSDCTYCNPDEEGKACEACGKTYYYEDGHKRHCPGQPFACTDCGENGVGYHGCPRSTDGSLDEFAEDP